MLHSYQLHAATAFVGNVIYINEISKDVELPRRSEVATDWIISAQFNTIIIKVAFSGHCYQPSAS